MDPTPTPTQQKSKLTTVLSSISELGLSKEEKQCLLDELNKPEPEPETPPCCTNCNEEISVLRKDLENLKLTLSNVSSKVSKISNILELELDPENKCSNLGGCPFGFGMAIDIDFASIIRWVVIGISVFSILCSICRIFNSSVSGITSRCPIPRPPFSV
jgi:hypothetical protein